MRFFLVSVAALGLNLVLLRMLVELGAGKVLGAGDRDRARDAVQLHRQQALVVQAVAWPGSSQRPSSRCWRSHRPRAASGGAPYDEQGRLVDTIPFTPETPPQALTETKAVAVFLVVPKVKDWVGRYPKKSLVTAGDLREGLPGLGRQGLVGPGGGDRHRPGRRRERCRSPRPGPGRRSPGRWRAAATGAFGGKKINSPEVWLAFCAVFLIGLADLRRPLQPAQPRPARAALLLGLALVLQPRPDLHERAARLSGPRLPARPHDLDRDPRPAAADLAAALAGVAARRRDRFPRAASRSG